VQQCACCCLAKLSGTFYEMSKLTSWRKHLVVNKGG